MATESVPITPGSGKDIAVDTVDGKEYQLVKLVDSTDDSDDRTGVGAHPLTVEARMAFVDFDDSIVPVTDNGDNHWLPVAVRGGSVDISAVNGVVQVAGSVAEEVINGPSDGVWATDKQYISWGLLVLSVRSTGGTPTVAAFGASATTSFGGTYDQQLPLLVPDGDTLVLADTFTPGAGARFCYILSIPPALEIRAVSGGTSDLVDATLIVAAFNPQLLATVSSGGASGDTELTTLDFDTGGGTDTVAVTGILLPKSGGAVAGGTSTDPLRVDPTGSTAQPVTDNGGSLTVDNAGTFAVQADTELTTADLDTGAGTDTRAVVGLVGSRSGGGVLIPGDATAGLKVDLGADNDVTVTNATASNLKAEVTAAASGHGTAAAAMRVELPTDGTGVVGLNAGSNAIGKLATNDGVDIGDVTINNTSLTVAQGTAASLNATVVGTGTFAVQADTELPTAAALADGTANPTAPLVGSANEVFNGTTWDRAWGNSLDGLQVNQKYTIWGDSLADGISTLWTQTTANGGTVTSTVGEGQLKTSTATNGSSQIVGPTIAYRPGSYAWMNSAIRMGDTGTAGDIRRWGMYTVSGTTPQEGFYYELSGTTLNAVYVKAGSATATAAGSWSVATFAMDTNYHSYQIRYTANSVLFIIDNVLRHAVTGTSAALTTSLTLPIAATNVKTSGATDITLAIRNIGAGAFGDPGTFQVEDFPHEDGHRGIMGLAVRKNTAASTSGADGDYQPLITNTTGHLWVDASGQTLTVGNVATVGTSVVPGTGATHLGKAEDAGHTTADTGVFVLSVRQSEANSLTSSAGSDNDYAAFNTDARGLLQVVARPYVSRIRVASASLTTASTAYTIGDQAGTIMTFAGCARVSGGTGTILSAMLLDKGDVGTDYRLHIYRSSVTLAGGDNGAWSVSDADQQELIGIVTMPSMFDVGANRVTTLANIGLPYDCAATSLFVGIETRTANAVYAAATDLNLVLTVALD